MKKIIALSIGVTIVIVLTSFAGVVGFQSIKNTSVKYSPLFMVRTKRAINEKQDALTSNYIGKGNEISIPIPTRHDQKALLRKVIDRINIMNEKEFNRFIRLVVHYLDKSQDADTQEIIDPLHLLRDNPDEIKKYITQEKEHKFYTAEGCETVGFIWIPECWLVLVWLTISPFIWLILSLATMIFDCL